MAGKEEFVIGEQEEIKKPVSSAVSLLYTHATRGRERRKDQKKMQANRNRNRKGAEQNRTEQNSAASPSVSRVTLKAVSLGFFCLCAARKIQVLLEPVCGAKRCLDHQALSQLSLFHHTKLSLKVLASDLIAITSWIIHSRIIVDGKAVLSHLPFPHSVLVCPSTCASASASASASAPALRRNTAAEKAITLLLCPFYCFLIQHVRLLP